MYKLRVVLGIALLVGAAGGQGVKPGKTSLKVGDVAPDLTLPATTAKSITLSEFRGKKNVVLAFFPAAFTGG